MRVTGIKILSMLDFEVLLSPVLVGRNISKPKPPFLTTFHTAMGDNIPSNLPMSFRRRVPDFRHLSVSHINPYQPYSTGAEESVAGFIAQRAANAELLRQKLIERERKRVPVLHDENFDFAIDGDENENAQEKHKRQRERFDRAMAHQPVAFPGPKVGPGDDLYPWSRTQLKSLYFFARSKRDFKHANLSSQLYGEYWDRNFWIPRKMEV